MSYLMVPPHDPTPRPTLGPQVADWMEASLVFGPGDLRGRPYRLDDEDREIIDHLYEVHPKAHPRAGKRRYDLGVLMVRKGSKKTERAAAIAAAELAPDSPVRCDGFRRQGSVWVPQGRPVTDPYIPLVAFSEKQAEDTTYHALYVMVSEGPQADLYDIGLERIMRRSGDGRAEALSNAPDSRDGGRTTFQVKEETHRWTLARQIDAHHTMTANLAKRPIAEPWEMHVTTAYTPGEGSLAEMMHDSARKLTADEARESRMWFFHRWADERLDTTTKQGLRDAIVDASGPAIAAMSDVDRIANQWTQAGADEEYLDRVWLNRIRRRNEQAFDAERWKVLGKPGHVVPAKALIALGFDGSKVDDHTALIATEVITGHQWPIGIWDPSRYESEQALIEAVELGVDHAFSAYTVTRLYADPPYWKEQLAMWRAKHGDKTVLPWETYRNRPMGFALRSYAQAMADGTLSHDGDARFAAHIGHCVRRILRERDDKGERLWTVRKERDHSPLKIDAAVAGCLSWEARNDSIAAGLVAAMQPRTGPAFLSY